MLFISSCFKTQTVGILWGRSSFKELRRRNAHIKDVCECTKYSFSLFFFSSISPRICWITHVLLEVAQGCLSLFREPLPDKLPLMSVWVSILLIEFLILSFFRNLCLLFVCWMHLISVNRMTVSVISSSKMLLLNFWSQGVGSLLSPKSYTLDWLTIAVLKLKGFQEASRSNTGSPLNNNWL